MSANLLKEVAAKHFAKDGFNGVSLSDIAGEVGIKKPSIYAHFNGKEDLFLSVLEEAAEQEIHFIDSYFREEADEGLEQQLYSILVRYRKRYTNDFQVRFWLRTAFFPPAQLHDIVMEKYYHYLDQCEEELNKIFAGAIERGVIRDIGAGRASIAFIGLLDSVFVEMLYGGPDRTTRRIEASWYLYWRSLTA